MIYFDHNATTPLDERVLDAMLPFMKGFYGNPSSLYRHGRIARTAIDTAREQLAALIDSTASDIVFTSGGTEANNMALVNLSTSAGLAICATEHPSVTQPALQLKKQGIPLSVIAVDANGLINQEAMDALVKTGTGGVSIMQANNETGVIQNISRWALQCRSHNILIHTDAVQSLGKIPVSFKNLAVNFMTVSSHKINGPKGCGALIFEKGTKVKPLLYGGGQEAKMRAGTENVAAIVGFGKAAELAKVELVQRMDKLQKLTKLLESGLKSIPETTIFADAVDRLPNTVLFGIRDFDGELLLMKLDKNNIAVSSGSACASGINDPSPVLLAMGINELQAKTAVRVSIGVSNTEEEINSFLNTLKSLVNQKR
jgi:cysteine desulfurase